MFIQLHTLTSYPGTLLNRDDAGFAKSLPFGGATRTRISSQCLKYHWRNFDGENALYRIDFSDFDEEFLDSDGKPKSLRSGETFRRRVAGPLLEEGYPERLVVPFAKQIQERVLSDEKLTKPQFKKLFNPDEDADLLAELDTKQVTIFGVSEVRYMEKLVREKVDELEDDLGILWDNPQADLDKEQTDRAYDVLKTISKGDLKKNLNGLRLASGLDAALFGRMVTSDALARGDAALHVAHAFTTHEEENESDFFTAVDELRRDDPQESGELGAGHLNSQDLTSGLFYSYVVIDVPLLVSNIEAEEHENWRDADRSLASEVARRFVHLMTQVSPGAMLGSTAPYAHAQFLFAETGTAQPRTLANAFEKPVTANQQGILKESCKEVGRYVSQMDAMYGTRTDRKLAVMEPTDGLLEALSVEEISTVPDIANWTAQQITDA